MKVIPCDIPSRFVRLDLEVYSGPKNGHGLDCTLYVGAGLICDGYLVAEEEDVWECLKKDPAIRIVTDYHRISDSILIPTHQIKVVAVYPPQ